MDFKAAQNYWVEHDKQGKKMPGEQLAAVILVIAVVFTVVLLVQHKTTELKAN